VRQKITLEPIDTGCLFYLYPMEEIRVEGGHPRFSDPIGENYFAHRPHSAYLRYTVTSRLLPEGRGPLEGASPPRTLNPRVRSAYLQLPEHLSPRIGELARSITARAGAKSDRAKAVALQSYLENPRNFLYTLDIIRTPGREPVEDFLFTQRAGHCEYFAAAMAVMLRTLEVPARLVNGFRMGEWNELGEFYTVRQMDAHSWVEAYLEGQGWTTFDPSPREEKQTSAAGQIGAFIWQLVEVVESHWVNYVIGYDQGEQKEILARLRNVCRLSKDEGLSALFRPFQWLSALDRGNSRPDESPPTAEGGHPLAPWICATLILTFLIGLFILMQRFFRRAARPASRRATAEYQRFLVTMARRGFEKHPAETPWEFLERLQGLSAARFALARQATALFTLIRYGGRGAMGQTMRTLRGCVKELAAR
jgi:hypothetical protein